MMSCFSLIIANDLKLCLYFWFKIFSKMTYEKEHELWAHYCHEASFNSKTWCTNNGILCLLVI